MITRSAEPAAVSLRDILMLALPALGVLAAPSLYLLLDTAVVGRLGATGLAALAAATTVQAVVTTQLTFLSYGTTARAARLFGAGQVTAAIAEGVQATFVALGVGSLLAFIIVGGAPVITRWIADDPQVAVHATTWLRIAGLGIPLILCTTAGNGWLRGIQNTKIPLILTLCGVIPSAILVPILVARFGVAGSATANLIGETITAVGFLIVLATRHRGRWTPQWRVIKDQLRMGRDLVVRSLSFQISALAAATVAARFGQASLAAHQVIVQVWSFLTLVLDSLAIAAQALIGAALGADSAPRARHTATRLFRHSLSVGTFLALLLLAGYRLVPRIFTSDPAVLEALSHPWFLLVVLVLLGSAVFVADGVLLGAGDLAYLRTTTIIAAFVAYIPIVVAAWFFHWGLVGVWTGTCAMLLVRLGATLWRLRTGHWATTGATAPSSRNCA